MQTNLLQDKTLIIVENKLEDLQTESSLKFCRPLVEALLKGLQKRFGKFLKLSRNDPAVISAIIATATHTSSYAGCS